MISEGDSASASVGSTLVLVTVNGHKAFHSDFDNFVDAIKSQFFGLEFGNSSARDKVFVLQSKANESFATMDGLPKLAHRLASEIHQWVRDSVLPKIDVPTDLYFSLVGHSLGGLIIRVALPHLFGLSTSSSVDTLSLIDLVQANPNVCSFNPTSYMSICTPHLGSRRTDGNDAWNYIFHSGIELTCNLLMGRTGKELLLLDNPSERTSSMSLQQWLPQLPQLSSSAIFTADGLDSEGTKQPIIRRLTALVSPSGVSPPSTVSQNESGASAEDSRARDEASYKGILKGFPTIPFDWTVIPKRATSPGSPDEDGRVQSPIFEKLNSMLYGMASTSQGARSVDETAEEPPALPSPSPMLHKLTSFMSSSNPALATDSGTRTPPLQRLRKRMSLFFHEAVPAPDEKSVEEPESLPILLRMTEPSSIYAKSLCLFNYCTVVSCLRDDLAVGYCSAAITDTHPHSEVLNLNRELNQVEVVSFSGFRPAHPASEPSAGAPGDIRSDSTPKPQAALSETQSSVEPIAAHHVPVGDFEGDEAWPLYERHLFKHDGHTANISKSVQVEGTVVELPNPVFASHYKVIADEPGVDTRSPGDPSGSPNTRSRTGHVWADDSVGVSRFMPKMLHDLNEIRPWRRINIDLKVESSLDVVHVHAMVVGKSFPWQSIKAKQSTLESAWYLARIILLDFKINKTQKTKGLAGQRNHADCSSVYVDDGSSWASLRDETAAEEGTAESLHEPDDTAPDASVEHNDICACAAPASAMQG